MPVMWMEQCEDTYVSSVLCVFILHSVPCDTVVTLQTNKLC